jgi:hypothetical protein
MHYPQLLAELQLGLPNKLIAAPMRFFAGAHFSRHDHNVRSRALVHQSSRNALSKLSSKGLRT